jgi:cyclic pyranopterin monophosphate synthase
MGKVKLPEFSHYSDDGRAVMVDISPKISTERYAKAFSFVKMDSATVHAIENKLLPKGDIFEVARIAGIMAAKKTSDLIPMCHPLKLDHIDVTIKLDHLKSGVEIYSVVKLTGKTGVEMEALTAVSITALTVYDMCKAVDRGMTIEYVRLMAKSGGKSGIYLRPELQEGWNNGDQEG